MSIAPDATGRDTVESLLAYSLTKPGAWPDQPWEDDVVAKVGGKIFAFFTEASVGAERDQKSGAEPSTVGVKCGHNRDDADEWLLRFPGDAAVMPYIGRSGWNTLTLGGSIPDDELRLAVDESYEMVVAKLPRRLRPE